MFTKGKGDASDIFGLSDFYDNPVKELSLNDLQTKSIEYVTNDKFIIREYFESYFRSDVYTEQERTLFNFKSKIEKSCERITN